MVIRIVAVRLCWMLAALLAAGSAYASDDIQVLIDKAEQTVWTEPAGPELAVRLAAKEDSPLLVFRRLSSASGVPVEYVVSHYRGDRYQVHMTLNRERPDARTESSK